MDGWQLITWNFQYLIGGIISLIISVYVYLKSKNSRVTRIFFIFGICVTGSNLTNFIHRSAPNAIISNFSFRFTGLCMFLIFGLIPIMLLTMYKEGLKYWFILVPSFIFSILILVMGPFYIIQTSYGWSYEMSKWFAYITITYVFMYTLVAVIVGSLMIKNIKSFTIKLKVKIILIAIAGVYFLGLILTNFFLLLNPYIPPLGGFITTLQFLLIAYAISIPTEKITIVERSGDPSTDELYNNYVTFLNRFREEIPGKELGETPFRFYDYLEGMGLQEVISHESDELVVNQENLSNTDIEETPDLILRVIREVPWGDKTANEFSDLLKNTYEKIEGKNNFKADRWFNDMLREHGGYLYSVGILEDILPEERGSPDIFKDLKHSEVFLFKEERPEDAYEKYKELMRYGFKPICITKLKPERLERDYGVHPSSITRIDIHRPGGDIMNLKALSNELEEVTEKQTGVVLIIDCIDQMIHGKGYKKTLKFLKSAKELFSDKGDVLLLSINVELVDDSQVSNIEELLSGDKSHDY